MESLSGAMEWNLKLIIYKMPDMTNCVRELFVHGQLVQFYTKCTVHFTVSFREMKLENRESGGSWYVCFTRTPARSPLVCRMCVRTNEF